MSTVAEVNARVDALSANADQIWILLCGFLVFWMHAGFAMLEAGSVRRKNTINILFKNVGTIAISAIMFFFLGYPFAYGDLGRENDFIGSGDYALYESQNDNKHNWFFQFAFAATASTILSGAIAGRAKLEIYFFACMIITAFIYPVVVHWVWSPQGWLSAFKTDRTRVIGHGADENACGFIDYAGSGVVHLTGGVSGLIGALFVGARTGRWENPSLFSGHNYPLCAIGVLILWFGWYGFNCGSTLAFDGAIASKVAVTTTLSPSSACLTGMLVQLFMTRAFEGKWTWDLVNALNCVLAGLVSITAGCSVVHDWHAIFIGMFGAVIYMGASALMVKVHVDDPVDAVAVHGFCGMWGCLAVGMFAEPSEIVNAYSLCTDANGNRNGVQFGVQLAGVLSIIAWVGTTVTILFLFMRLVFGELRVSEEEEEAGLDASEHGANAYEADIAAKGSDMEMQRKASGVDKKAAAENEKDV
mmetsp:Transcript_13429/g.27170  ORF Transcript_13429/g.27170 Transcript_13429/m.27170 type:complete len:473 (-) Transcript_13429:255-1673(-)